jgi:uncharacterized protein with PIN domain
MVVETSAILAVLLEEPEAAEFAQLIEDDPAPFEVITIYDILGLP